MTQTNIVPQLDELLLELEEAADEIQRRQNAERKNLENRLRDLYIHLVMHRFVEKRRARGHKMSFEEGFSYIDRYYDRIK